ncbi:hypothetical protein JCM9534A_09990 [Catenuloplanes indicus JCM 9534]
MALVAGAGAYLARTTSAARADALADFAGRAETSARLVGATLAGSDGQVRELAEHSFSGTPAEMDSRRGGGEVEAAWHAVMTAGGRILFADPVALVPPSSALTADPGFGIAIRTGKLAFSNVIVSNGTSNVIAYRAFAAPDGTRVLVLPIPVSQVAVLFQAVGVAAGTAYVIDGDARVVSSSSGVEAGVPLPDPALAAALAGATRGIAAGDTYFASSPVEGSPWRFVTTASRSALLAPVQSTARVAWQLFAAFAAAMTVILLIGLWVLRGAARLARARLHDTLTGLPNRALFMDRAETAVADWRRRRGTHDERRVAALFLDLDGFKPVNDTYGHAAGDALLQQVAGRLTDAVRPGDYVSRFGGDEFLVLCQGIARDDDVCAVADRIRRRLTEPFEVAGRTVSIGVSIGIATLDDGIGEAAALIHHADLALYRAKENGRGRVELFVPA